MSVTKWQNAVNAGSTRAYDWPMTTQVSVPERGSKSKQPRMPGRASRETLERLAALARSRHRSVAEQVELIVNLGLAASEGAQVDFESERIEACAVTDVAQ